MNRWLFLVIGFALAATGPASAAGYTLKGAMEAAGALMPTNRPQEFVLFNLPAPGAKPSELLAAMRKAAEQKAALAVCSPRIEWILELLTQALAAAPGEKFDGLFLIVVAQRVEQTRVAAALKNRGVRFRCGIFE